MTETERHREVIAAILAAGLVQHVPELVGSPNDVAQMVHLYRRLLQEVSKTPQRMVARRSL